MSKTINISKKTIFLLIMLCLFMYPATTRVFAWGPERETFTMEVPADHVTFNSLTNNPALGDEREFVGVREKDSGNKYALNLELEVGKDYEVYIYYHNNASKTFNTEAYDYKGVAFNVKMSTDFPDKLAAGEVGQVYGAISSPDATPTKVWDTADITAKEDMTLHYLLGSAKIHNSWAANGSIMPSYIFGESGTYLGMNELNGMIFGCDEYAGYVTYTIRTVGVETTPPDDVEPDPGTPEPPADPEPEPDPGTRTGDSYNPIIILLAAFAAVLSIVAIVMVLRHKK